MIPIIRGAEPPELKAIRRAQLAAMAQLRRKHKRDPKSEEINAYQAVKQNLLDAQHGKCCYCERWYTLEYNDVEHYRPKASAVRLPGSDLTHGYWWLAWTWNNLLFACPLCNRGKKDLFPLETGSPVLKARQTAPGGEKAWIIDPASGINPVEHIEYKLRTLNGQPHTGQWWATARNGSEIGSYTFDVCQLNHPSQRDLRDKYYTSNLAPRIRALENALTSQDTQKMMEAWCEAIDMLKPCNEYVAFKYDVFRHFIANDRLQAAIGQCWPEPAEVGW